MFFEDEHFSARIFAVERFDCGTKCVNVKPRKFSALAWRMRGNADFLFADGSTLSAKTGDIIYLPAGLSYRANYHDTEVLAIHFWDHGQCRSAEAFPPSPELTRAFEELHDMWKKSTPSARMEATARFYRILAQLSRPREHTPESPAFQSAVEILTREYCDPELDLSAVCARAGISPSAFRRNFTARYGKPPIKYLNELRLLDAQKRLVGSRDSVSTIAAACGFHDVKYFARAVKSAFGCTPSELRSV